MAETGKPNLGSLPTGIHPSIKTLGIRIGRRVGTPVKGRDPSHSRRAAQRLGGRHCGCGGDGGAPTGRSGRGRAGRDPAHRRRRVRGARPRGSGGPLRTGALGGGVGAEQGPVAGSTPLPEPRCSAHRPWSPPPGWARSRARRPLAARRAREEEGAPRAPRLPARVRQGRGRLAGPGPAAAAAAAAAAVSARRALPSGRGGICSPARPAPSPRAAPAPDLFWGCRGEASQRELSPPGFRLSRPSGPLIVTAAGANCGRSNRFFPKPLWTRLPGAPHPTKGRTESGIFRPVVIYS